MEPGTTHTERISSAKQALLSKNDRPIISSLGSNSIIIGQWSIKVSISLSTNMYDFGGETERQNKIHIVSNSASLEK